MHTSNNGAAIKHKYGWGGVGIKWKLSKLRDRQAMQLIRQLLRALSFGGQFIWVKKQRKHLPRNYSESAFYIHHSSLSWISAKTKWTLSATRKLFRITCAGVVMSKRSRKTTGKISDWEWDMKCSSNYRRHIKIWWLNTYLELAIAPWPVIHCLVIWSLLCWTVFFSFERFFTLRWYIYFQSKIFWIIIFQNLRT